MKRRTFLRLLPAGAVWLAGCGAQQPAETAAEQSAAEEYPLQYAREFTARRWPDGSVLVTVAGQDKFLAVPAGQQPPADAPADAVILPRPAQNLYLVSSSVMDMFVCLEQLSAVRFAGAQASSWYLPEAKAAMEAGEILYAGKYSAPDYERLLAEGCGLAIENTMIYHTPEVKEQLEGLGIPVLVERSSYESDPLARMEWIKCYGLLLGCEQKAEQVFDAKLAEIEPVLGAAPTGKTVAFFSVTSNGLITVRKGTDYVAQMIEMAGGTYVFADLTGEGSNLATVKLSLEDFYAAAKDADILIYNGSIEGEVQTREQLIGLCEMLAEFKAVQAGDVWCTGQNLFQHSMEMTELMLDMNRVFSQPQPDETQLYFLRRVQ